MMTTNSYFSGSGPGAQAPDGCSVEVYRHSSYRGEFEPFRARFKPGLSVLELGCGSGRLTRTLLAFGCRVTAADNSSEMLAALPSEAQPVLCGIEDLALAQRFDVVLLASGLINHADAAVRASMLRVAAQHLRPDG
ncbi:MAG: class I SAM-dependent methyltransferase, partial [Burkholderiaceae bacterium]|nr:class I SAM-dependent methyltransferase [Burkholderiaceae bacterium]